MPRVLEPAPEPAHGGSRKSRKLCSYVKLFGVHGPAHLGLAERRSSDDDLQARPWPGAVDKEQAFLDRERGALGTEYPDLAIRNLNPARAASAFRATAIGMQMEMDCVRQILLQPQLALRRLQNIDAFEPVTRGRKL